MNNQALKSLAGGFYDLQKLRIQIGNRIVANFKLRLGQQTSKPESDMDDEGLEILGQIRKQFKLISCAAAEFPSIKAFEGTEVISDYAELVLVKTYEDLLQQEEANLKPIKKIIHQHPLWKQFLEGVCGCGELMAMCILSKIDISKSKYPSSLWKYCGVDVAADGAGRSRKKDHLVMREYVNKAGEPDIKEGITFNPFVKTKLLGVLGPAFLKAKSPKYAPIYYEYKHRLESHPKYKDEKPGHRHNMAIRYMVKMFLIDLHIAWRTIEGLPVSKPYHEAKLGMVHREKVA
jgi:hypothetical protein